MIRMHFVGDGPRDEATLPCLVENILGIEIEAKAHSWKSLHLRSGKGFQKKLRFSVSRALDDDAAGLVAVVDRDKSEARSRLRELQQERNDHRSKLPPFPTSLGEAAPHGEAWLLADENAVREALSLKMEVAIPSVSKTKDPKGMLERLIQQSARRGESVTPILTEITRLVDEQRCVHRDETGFAYFAEDVRRELAHLVPQG
jgi:hypothetical protein